MRPKVLGKEKLEYQGFRLGVKSAKILFPGGASAKWEYMEHPEVVGALPVDDKGNVYLVKEWRLAWKKEILQIPTGVFRGRTEKDRIKHLRNELREEIGMDAGRIKKLAFFYAASTMRFVPNVYLATKLFPSPKQPDGNEFVTIVKMPFSKAYRMFLDGKVMTTASTLIAFLLAKQILKK